VARPFKRANDTVGSSDHARRHATIGAMLHERDGLLDVVLFDVLGLFDVLDAEAVDELCDGLRADRLVWVHKRDEVELLAVSVRSGPDDLAVLLRTLEAWVAAHFLGTVLFELDGREYVLRGRPAGMLQAAV